MSKKRKPKTRDWLMVKIINGATKSGTHKDHKKDKNKKECRNWKYKGDNHG